MVQSQRPQQARAYVLFAWNREKQTYVAFRFGRTLDTVEGRGLGGWPDPPDGMVFSHVRTWAVFPQIENGVVDDG